MFTKAPLNTPLITTEATSTISTETKEQNVKYRNEYAKKAFSAVWTPTSNILNIDFPPEGSRMSVEDIRKHGAERRQIGGCEACLGGCMCLLGKTITLAVGGLFSSLAGCGGFFTGAAKDACCNSDGSHTVDNASSDAPALSI